MLMSRRFSPKIYWNFPCQTSSFIGLDSPEEETIKLIVMRWLEITINTTERKERSHPNKRQRNIVWIKPKTPVLYVQDLKIDLLSRINRSYYVLFAPANPAEGTSPNYSTCCYNLTKSYLRLQSMLSNGLEGEMMGNVGHNTIKWAKILL